MPLSITPISKTRPLRSSLVTQTAFSAKNAQPLILRVRSANVVPKRSPGVHPTSLSSNDRVATSRQPREHVTSGAAGARYRSHSTSTGPDSPPILYPENGSRMSGLIPPQPPATWTHTPEQVTALIKELIAKDRALWDKVGSLSEGECSFESVCLLPSAILKSGCLRLWNPARSSLSTPAPLSESKHSHPLLLISFPSLAPMRRCRL